MNIDKSNQYGTINISNEAIAVIAKNAVMMCYGVVDVANKKSLMESDDTKGIIVRKAFRNTYEIDVFIIVAFGVRITEVVTEVQKKVKYDLERKFNVKFKAINVYVSDIKNI